MGDSTGRWDGETLVVDVTGLNGRTWLDSGGHPHSDALHVIERFRRSGPDTIAYEVTVEDPQMYSKPFKNVGVLRRAKAGDELMEYACDENNLDRDQRHLQPGAK